jgi:hypothetical protein
MIVPLVLAMTFMIRHEGDISKSYVPALRKIAEETPLYPGSAKAGKA